MLLINLQTHDPFFNLALEEVLLKKSNEEYLILGINNPAVIIGKHQAAHRETDIKFITENRIPVIRRISGGGTVFHDKGNLNFTFIKQSEEGRQVDFRMYTRPVIEFLIGLGINAVFEGKNDIRVDGLKISGNAEHVHRNRVLHHGTLLFSASMDMLKNSIRSDKSRYVTRGVDSNPASVMNLNEKLNIFRDMREFSEGMLHHFSATMPDIGLYSLSRSETEEAASLADSKYRSWEWNFAYGPEYLFKNAFLFENELHFCIMQIRHGVVEKCTIDGKSNLMSVAGKLIGCRHMVPEFIRVFEQENIRLTGDEIYYFF